MQKNKLMKRIRMIACLLAFIALRPAIAQQGEAKMTVNLMGALPVGGLKDLTANASLRGADIAILYGVSDKVGVGLNIGFQDFYQKFPREVYQLQDGSHISAVVTNSIQAIPFLATGKYNFMPASIVQPYAAAGLGGAFLVNRQFVGESPNDENKIVLAMRPAAGVYIPFRRGGEAGLNASVSYTHLAYKSGSTKGLGFIGFGVGISFPMRNQ